MANTLVLTIAIDPSNAEHLKVLALIGNMGLFAGAPAASAPAPVSASPAPAQDVPAPAPAPEAPAKVYEAPEADVVCYWHVKGRYVVPSKDADKLTYIGRNGVRKVLNARIREAGGVWDTAAKAYGFKSVKEATKFAKDTSATVTPAQWQERVDARAARAARKASK